MKGKIISFENTLNTLIFNLLCVNQPLIKSKSAFFTCPWLQKVP